MVKNGVQDNEFLEYVQYADENNVPMRIMCQ